MEPQALTERRAHSAGIQARALRETLFPQVVAGADGAIYLIPLRSPLVCPNFLLTDLTPMGHGLGRCSPVPRAALAGRGSRIGGSAAGRLCCCTGLLFLLAPFSRRHSRRTRPWPERTTREFFGTRGDKTVRKERVLLPPPRDPGERPDTS